jgi:hypothetical protein
LFRFASDDLETLAAALRLPERIVTLHRDSVIRREAIAIVLHRLAFPGTSHYHRRFFGRGAGPLSEIWHHVISHIRDTFAPRLLHRLDIERLAPRLQQFANAVQSRGSPLAGCVGFVDGPLRAIARFAIDSYAYPTRSPSYGQRDFYNGKDRIHALKFQGVIFPDGIIAQMAGPYFGKSHDARLYRESNLEAMMLDLNSEALGGPVELADAQYCLYGDLAYPLSVVLQKPFQGNAVDAEEHEYNTLMASLRMYASWHHFSLLIVRLSGALARSPKSSPLSPGVATSAYWTSQWRRSTRSLRCWLIATRACMAVPPPPTLASNHLR